MTRRAPCGFARVLGLALLLALSSPALAGGLYQWVTPEGRVEIGPTPPFGVNAVPWVPGQPDPASPATSPAPPAAAAPAEAEPAAAAPAETVPTARVPVPRGPALRKPKSARGKAADECAKLGTAARELAQQVQDAEREIAQLEAKIEKLEASDVAYSHSTNCTGKDAYGGSADCSSTSFDRDAEIERSQQALAHAQERLEEAEESARRANVPEKCH